MRRERRKLWRRCKQGETRESLTGRGAVCDRDGASNPRSERGRQGESREGDEGGAGRARRCTKQTGLESSEIKGGRAMERGEIRCINGEQSRLLYKRSVFDEFVAKSSI